MTSQRRARHPHLRDLGLNVRDYRRVARSLLGVTILWLGGPAGSWAQDGATPQANTTAGDAARDRGRADVEVTVVATRSPEATVDSPGTASAITADEIQIHGAESLEDALRYEPGVSVPFDFAGQDGLIPYLGGGAQGINIRGIEGNRIALLLDGIRQPEDFVAQSFLGAGGPGRVYFDPAVLDQVEIFKSASSSLYGSDALGGTVNARTVSPGSLLGPELDGYSFENRLSYAGVNDSVNNRLVAGAGNGRLAGSVVVSYRDGHERENNGDLAPNPQDFDSLATVATARYQTAQWSLEGTVDVFRSESFTDAIAAEGSFFDGLLVNEDVTQDDERERTRLSLTGALSPGGGLWLADTARAHAYWQEAEFATVNVQRGQTQFGPAPTPRDRTNDIRYLTDIYGLDLQLEKLLIGFGGTHTLRYGLEYSLSDVESQFLRTDLNPDGTETTSDRIGMAPSEVTRLGLFILDEFNIGLAERWSVVPGLRVDLYDVEPTNTEAFLARTVIPGTETAVEAVDYDNTAIAPSLAVLYRWTPAVNSYVSYSRGIRNPSAEELNGVFTHGTDFIVVPNPDLGEETSDSFEVGVQGATRRNNFQVAVYFNQYDDFLESNVLIEDNPEPEPDVLTTVNRRAVEIYGIEATWDWRLDERTAGLDGLEGGLSFGFSEGERTDVDQPLNSIDPWKIVGYLGYRQPDERFGLRLTATHIGEKSESEIDATTDAGPLDPVDSVTLLDLSAFVRLGKHFELSAGVNNLTDAEYFLWSTARRGGGHGGEAASRNTQPGLNGFIAATIQF